jgi:hypothetical protein
MAIAAIGYLNLETSAFRITSLLYVYLLIYLIFFNL